MTESTIHQLYCTHCTYATSYLHQRGDEAVGQQVFEYSTRSGSVARERSHDYFRQIEPYMYYHLPGDLPAADALKHDANTTNEWRRLLYMPSVSGLRVLAHIAYRTTDTKGRPGSYFSHVLLSENANGSVPTWSAVDALRLWGSPGWVDTDRPDLPFQLSSVASLEELNGANQPAISDQLFLKFLTQPKSSTAPSIDTHHIVPLRFWKKMPEERQQLVSDTLSGFLGLNLERRQSMLLAIEPSLAALIFYGIARLLPRTGIGEKLSFSTFECDEDRPQTALAATTFHQPQEGRLPSEASQSRGFAINTFQSNGSTIDRSSPHAEFATKIVARLVQHGFAHTDQFIAELERVGATETADLVEMQQVADLADQAMLSAETPEFQQALRSLRSDRAMRALRERVGQKLVASKSQTAAPNPNQTSKAIHQELSQHPARVLAIVHLLGSDSETIEEVHESIQKLLYRLVDSHPNTLSNVLQSTEIPIQVRLRILERVIRKDGKIPTDCPELWTPPRDAAKYPLLVELFAHRPVDQSQKYLKLVLKTQLSRDQVQSICQAFADQEAVKYGRLLVWFADQLLGNDARRQDELNPLLNALRDSKKFRAKFLGVYTEQCPRKPHGETSSLGKALTVRLDKLPHDPQLEKNLEVLGDSQLVLTDDACKRIEGWQGVRDSLHRIRDHQAKPSGFVEKISSFVRQKQREKELDDFGRELSRHAERAVPEYLFEGDDIADQRANTVITGCGHILKSVPLPSTIKVKLKRVFEGQDWDAQSSQPVERSQKPGAQSKPLWTWPPTPTTSAIAAAIVFIAVLAVIFNGDDTPATDPPVAQKNPSSLKPSNTTATPDQPRNSDAEDTNETQNPDVDEQQTTPKKPKPQDQTSTEEMVVADSNPASETNNESTAANADTTKPKPKEQTPPVTAENQAHVVTSEKPEHEPETSTVLQLTDDIKELNGRKVYYTTLPNVNHTEWTELAKLPEGRSLSELSLHIANESLIEANSHPDKSLRASAILDKPSRELDTEGRFDPSLCEFRWNRESNSVECQWQTTGTVKDKPQFEHAVRYSILRVKCGGTYYFISFLKPVESKKPLQLVGELPFGKTLIQTKLISGYQPMGEGELISSEEPEKLEKPPIENLIQLPNSEKAKIELLHHLRAAMNHINWRFRRANALVPRRKVLDKSHVFSVRLPQAIEPFTSYYPTPKGYPHKDNLFYVGEKLRDEHSLEDSSPNALTVQWEVPAIPDAHRFQQRSGLVSLATYKCDVRLIAGGEVSLPFVGDNYHYNMESREPQCDFRLRIHNSSSGNFLQTDKLSCSLQAVFSIIPNDSPHISNEVLNREVERLSTLLSKFRLDVRELAVYIAAGKDLAEYRGSGATATGESYKVFFRTKEDGELSVEEKIGLTWETGLYDAVRDEILASTDKIYHLIYRPYVEVVRETIGDKPQFSGTLYRIVGGELRQDKMWVRDGVLVKAIEADLNSSSHSR